MNVIAVPVLPPAVYYMENCERPPWRGCRGRTLLTILGWCSAGDKCDNCPYLERCRAEYDFIIDTDFVKNWKETERHVTRYIK